MAICMVRGEGKQMKANASIMLERAQFLEQVN